MGIGRYYLLIVLLGPILFSISINDAFAEITISDDSTGGDCSTIGTWNSASRTCTFTSNVSETVVVGSNNITLDGNGYAIDFGATSYEEACQNPTFGKAIELSVKTNIVIKNFNIQNSCEGIVFSNSVSSSILDNVFTNNYGYRIYVSQSTGTIISGNTMSSSASQKYGTGIFHDTTDQSGAPVIENNDISNTREAIVVKDWSTIKNNNLDDNWHGISSGSLSLIFNNVITFTDTNVSNTGISFSSSSQVYHNTVSNGNLGFYASGSSAKIFENTLSNNAKGMLTTNYNYIFQNNFLSNDVEATGGGTIFENQEQSSGNFWSDYSPICVDNNKDNFCDDPYPFSGGTIGVHDNHVWTIQDGWLTQIQTPGDITIEATDSTGSIVDFSVSATFDGNPTSVTCDSSSGSTFPIGETIVLCTASTGIVSTFAVTVQDTTPPAVMVEQGITVETTNSGGEVVTFQVSATDNIDGEITPSCQPASGSTFGIGETEVTCTATDSSGNVGTASFSVILIDISEPEPDTVPPVIVTPNDMAVEATSSNGSVVTFSVSVTDDTDGNLTPACSPASGSNFPIGITTVTCTATDAAGNSASGSFTITISEPQTELKIPQEFRQVAGDWSDGLISDSEFIQQVQIRIDQGTMVIPGIDTDGSGGSSGSIPDWVRNNAGWWSEGLISDEDFASGIQYLFNQGILPVTLSEEPEPLPDTIPPVIITPNSIIVEATSSNGSVVTFSVSATDDVDGSVTVTCSHVSGSVFPIGVTTITCSATDSAGNSTSKSFIITILEPEPEPEPTPSTSVIVRNAAGSSVPGCEETNECFLPYRAFIGVGGMVTWLNDDTAAHTATSGTPESGANGIFDSSLVMAGSSFSFTFDEPGTYDYFCMVHPWMRGQVIVGEGGPVTIPEPEPTPIPTPTPVPSEGQVFNAPGSSVPGCEETNSCFIPFEIRIDVSDTVTWLNDDTAAHTSTSGSAQEGPSGVFDSSLVMAGSSFSFTFDESGIFPYFCMVHPWMQGVVVVGEGVFLPEPEPTPDITISVSTDKRIYDLGDLVQVGVTLDGTTKTHQVAIDVADPTGTTIITRTVSVSPDSIEQIQFRISDNFKTGSYTVAATTLVDGKTIKDKTFFKVKSQFNQFRIVSVEVTDQQGHPSTLQRGDIGFIKVLLDSNKQITTLITINLFDSDLTSIGIGSVKSTLTSGSSEIIISFLIPDFTALGDLEIFVNAFSDWPSNGGIPLTNEFSIIATLGNGNQPPPTNPPPNPPPEPTSISVNVSDSLVEEGETIVISGKVSTIILETPVTIQIFNEGNLIEIAQIVVAQDGSFTHTIIAQGPQWQNEGDYTVRATYGEGNTAEANFEFFKKTVGADTSDFFEVDAGNSGTFDVEYTIRGGTVKNMIVDPEIFALIVIIESTGDGSLTLDLPRDFIDATKSDGSDDIFIITIDDMEVSYEELITNEKTRTITIQFEEGDSDIQIMGTFVI